VEGEDAGAGRDDGEWWDCADWAEDEADYRRVGAEAEYSEALSCGGRLSSALPATPQAASLRARRVVGGALSPASLQQRCGVARPIARRRVTVSLRTVERALVPIARRCKLARRPVCGSRRHRASSRRSALAGPRLRSAASGCGAYVCGNAGLFAAVVCPGLLARPPSGLVPRHGRHSDALAGCRGRCCTTMRALVDYRGAAFELAPALPNNEARLICASIKLIDRRRAL
jgi:hypothetical protein